MIHVSKESAAQQAENAMINAEKADKFMVAVWSVSENGELSCHRTTWQFPSARIEEAVRQLDKMINEEVRLTSVPLPLASFLRPAPANQFSCPAVEAQYDAIADMPAPPIVNSVLPLNSEDGE